MQDLTIFSRKEDNKKMLDSAGNRFQYQIGCFVSYFKFTCPYRTWRRRGRTATKKARQIYSMCGHRELPPFSAFLFLWTVVLKRRSYCGIVSLRILMCTNVPIKTSSDGGRPARSRGESQRRVSLSIAMRSRGQSLARSFFTLQITTMQTESHSNRLIYIKKWLNFNRIIIILIQ